MTGAEEDPWLVIYWAYDNAGKAIYCICSFLQADAENVAIVAIIAIITIITQEKYSVIIAK
jgi:hypothetical protein